MAMQIFTNLKPYPRVTPIIPRPEPMKVLVLGLSRTGTLSMWVALQKLGHKTYHFVETGPNAANNHTALWIKAVEAKYHGQGKPFEGEDFDQMLWDYTAVADAPCCLFADELVAAYPSAKVVLTTRTAQSWLVSMRRTFLKIIGWRSWALLSYFDPKVTGPLVKLLRLCAGVWSPSIHPWDPAADPVLLQSFEDHYAHVRKIVPKERLLEFHPSQGWGPLCDFLEVPAPEGPFPFVNDGDDVTKFFAIFYWIRWLDVLKRSLPWAGALGLAAGLRWWFM